MNDFFNSPAFSKLLLGLGILILALLIFWAGTLIGYREAQFSYDWDNNYASQFGSSRSPFVPAGDRDDSFMNADGAFGQIVGVRLPEIVIKGSSEVEKTVIIGTSTVVRRFRAFATTTDLAPGETVVVIGQPDSQGDIQAALVRIIPPPLSASGTPATSDGSSGQQSSQ